MSKAPKIAVVVYTEGNPIHVSSTRVQAVLDDAGYDARVVDLDWASPEEWNTLMDPFCVGRPVGRHSRAWVRDHQKYIVRIYDGPGGGFVRDYLNHMIELEAV